MSNLENRESNNSTNKLSNFDDLLKATNIASMKIEIDNNPELKGLVEKDFKESNISYLSPYKKYGINMKSLQAQLINHGLDLGKYGADGHFGSFTFIGIINLQKSLGLEVTGLADEKLLKFIYPHIFITLNKKEGRDVNDTRKYVKNTISNYNVGLEKKKDIVKLETKEEIKKVKSDIVIDDIKQIKTVEKENKLTNIEIIKYKEIERLQLSVLNEQKKSNNLEIKRLEEKLDNVSELLESNKNLIDSVNSDWNPFNDDNYNDEQNTLISEYNNIKNSLLVEAINSGNDIDEEIESFNNNRSYKNYNDKGLLIDKNEEVLVKNNKTDLESVVIETKEILKDREVKVLDRNKDMEEVKININYTIKKNDTIWGIIMNKTGSEQIAALTNGIKVFPGDKVNITDDFILIDGRDGEYKINIEEGKYNFFPKFKMKKVKKDVIKKVIKKEKEVFIEDKKEVITEGKESKKEVEYLVKKGDLLRRIIFKHFKNHKTANLFNSYRVNVGDKVIFKDDHVELLGKKINEVILIGSVEKIKEVINEDIEDFMKLTISERFEKITTVGKDGYFIIDFNKSFDKKTAKLLEKKININDIIPEEFNSCEVMINTEIKVWSKGRKKIAHKNYFDVVNREDGGEFDSKFAGRKYKKTLVKNLYAIKPFSKDFKVFDNTIINKNTKYFSLKAAYDNEQLIRNMYGDEITSFIDKYFKNRKSVIDENFFYSLLKQESSFDPNALSHTGTRGLGMITLDTTLGIIRENNRLLKNEKFMKDNPGIEKLLITNMDSITGDEKFEKYNKARGWFHGVDTQFYNPENSIKLSLSFLMNIESSLSFIKDPELKKDAILATYNGGTIVRSILKKDSSINSWDKLKVELKKELTVAKYKEVIGYVNIIRKTC